MEIFEIEKAGFKVISGSVKRMHNMRVKSLFLRKGKEIFVTWTFPGCSHYVKPVLVSELEI